jgi:nitrogen PTS system EIIA component
MHDLINILSVDLTICNYNECSNKKQLLEQISHLAHHDNQGIKYQEVLSTLQRRERLGSTAIGHGVAIPHARIPNLERPICTLLTLNKAIEFDRADTVAVDLVFGLLVSENANNDHLKILASLVEKLKSKPYREKLRRATTNTELYQIAIQGA